eukprot:jgi/Chrzof1/2025/UNPLg00680.t1
MSPERPPTRGRGHPRHHQTPKVRHHTDWLLLGTTEQSAVLHTCPEYVDRLIKPQIALACLDQEVEFSPDPMDTLKVNYTPGAGWLTPLAVNKLLYRHGTDIASLRTAVEP